MINLENLNDKTPLEIFDYYKQKIKHLNPNWTYTELSDPGITLLELFSWLKADQHKRLNRISNALKIKILNLLGVVPFKRCGSKTILFVSNLKRDVLVPKGTKWNSESMIFENDYSVFLTSADIIGLKFNNPEFQTYEDYYSIDGIKTFLLFGRKNKKKNETREFIIDLSSEVYSNSELNIYFEIFSSYSRNKILNNINFFPMGKIRWEYLGKSNDSEEIKWNLFDFVGDNTNSFLFSGIVKLLHKGKMCEQDGFYKIKASLDYSDYDFMPQIRGLKINVFEVVQKDTKCESIFVKKSDLTISYNSFSFEVKTHLSIYGDHLLYLSYKGSWKIIENFDVKSDFNLGICKVSCDSFSIDDFGNNDYVFLLVSYSKDIKNNMIIGSSKGFANLFFEMGFKKLSVYDQFKIMIGRNTKEGMLFDIWDRKDDLFGSSKFDNHFVYEENLKIIAFGNNHHGAVPPFGESNIRFSEISFTDAEDSNIKENMINDVKTQNLYLKNSNIEQIVRASGGRNDEPLEETSVRVSNIFNNSNRAVTMKDYVSIVKRTPGLIIDEVAVFVINNKINIAVRMPENLKLSSSYKKNIVRWIENFRLINSEIKIIGVKNVDLDIKTTLVIKPNYSGCEDIVREKIIDFIEKVNTRMGNFISYIDLVQMIEKLKFVEKVESFEIGSELGNKIGSDVPLNAIYNLKCLETSCIVNVEGV